MADMDKEVSIQTTRGKLIAGGTVVAAILLIQPLKDFFYTREEGQAQQAAIKELQIRLESHQAELTRRMERSSDKIVDQIQQAEERLTKQFDGVERRIETLEAVNRFSQSSGKDKKTSNN